MPSTKYLARMVTETQHIALEECDFGYSDKEMELLVQAWKEGKTIKDIAKLLNRPELEAIVLILHASDTRKLQRRSTCLWDSIAICDRRSKA